MKPTKRMNQEMNPPEKAPVTDTAVHEESPKSIRILYGYRGEQTNEIFLDKGIYAITTLNLMGFNQGLSEYLVCNGHAEWVYTQEKRA
jgi:hypothetical protein